MNGVPDRCHVMANRIALQQTRCSTCKRLISCRYVPLKVSLFSAISYSEKIADQADLHIERNVGIAGRQGLKKSGRLSLTDVRCPARLLSDRPTGTWLAVSEATSLSGNAFAIGGMKYYCRMRGGDWQSDYGLRRCDY
jgi:hypothetical protein